MGSAKQPEASELPEKEIVCQKRKATYQKLAVHWVRRKKGFFTAERTAEKSG